MSKLVMWLVTGLCSLPFVGQKVQILLLWVSPLSWSLCNSLFHPQCDKRGVGLEAILYYNLLSEVISYHFCLMMLVKQSNLPWYNIGNFPGCEYQVSGGKYHWKLSYRSACIVHLLDPFTLVCGVWEKEYIKVWVYFILSNQKCTEVFKRRTCWRRYGG